MNAAVTSKEEILKTSRELIRQQGWSSVSIRSVAAACGVSVGSIYNYFDSKAALLSETVGSVWQEIFHRPDDADVFQDVQTCVTWMYTRIAYGCEQYPGFSPCTPSASFGMSGPTASGACSRRGGIFWRGCARCSGATRRSGRTPLRTPSPWSNLRMCSFRRCSRPCCGRTAIPLPCWRSCAERCIKSKSPPCGGQLQTAK